LFEHVARICKNVFFIGYAVEWGTIDSYLGVVSKDFTKNQEFLASVDRFTKRKIEAPGIRMKQGDALIVPKSITIRNRNSDIFRAPKKIFMPIDDYTKAHGAPKQEMVIVKKFRGKFMSGVVVTRDEDAGMYEILEEEAAEVDEEAVLSADVEVRDGQSDIQLKHAMKLLADPMDDVQSFVILLAAHNPGQESSSSSSNPTSRKVADASGTDLKTLGCFNLLVYCLVAVCQLWYATGTLFCDDEVGDLFKRFCTSVCSPVNDLHSAV
jgi:hypothetical protein